MTVNGVRGEIAAVLAGVERRLCLTLGALAEIETALGVDGLPALIQRLKTLSARDLMVVLEALLRGGGEEALDPAQVEPGAAAEAVARAFIAASPERRDG